MNVKQVKECAGLLTCILNHKIEKSTVDFEWHGPQITPEVWNEVLSFFKWTYDNYKSEAQVRLYVNPVTRVWKAWAFPQKGKTGMTSKELTTPWGPEQFVFNDADGWILYGSAHHHCSGTAFQSSTDTEDEYRQDGLHITVGLMDKDHYDIDARLYQSHYKLPDFDLLDMWQVQTDLKTIPKHVMTMLPLEQLKLLAKWEMGVPPADDTPFPEQWKTNYVVDPEPVRQVIQTYGSQGSYYSGKRQKFSKRIVPNYIYAVERAIKSIAELVADQNGVEGKDRVGFVEVIRMIEEIDSMMSEWHMNLMDVMSWHDVEPAFLLEAVKVHLEQIREESKKHGKGKGKGKVKEITDTQPSDDEVTEAEQRNLMDFEGSNWRGNGLGLGG